jgi:hypothetical protein
MADPPSVVCSQIGIALRANIAETLLVPLIRVQDGKEFSMKNAKTYLPVLPADGTKVGAGHPDAEVALSAFTMLAAAASGAFISRATLQLENLALRHQLGVLRRSVKSPKLN